MTKGQRIRYLIDRSGTTQTDLAVAIGVSKQTLYKYINDIVTNIPSDNIEGIATFFGVSPAYIMGWDNIAPTDVGEGDEEYLIACRSKDGKRGVPRLTKEEYNSAKAFIQTLRKNTNENL